MVFQVADNLQARGMLRDVYHKIHGSKFQYCFKGVPLQPVSSWPYLSVEIDNTLAWTPHIDKVSKAASRTLGVVQRMLHAAQAGRDMVYQTLVRSKLEYASTTWSPQTQGKIRKLESQWLATIRQAHLRVSEEDEK